MRRSTTAAVSLLALLILWMLSGVFTSGKRETAVTEHSGKPVISVRYQERRAEDVAREVIARGRTAPAREVLLRAETAGAVEAVGARRGAKVKRGDLIARIETRDRQVNLKKAGALVRQRKLEFAAAQDLAKKGFQAETKVAEASANLESANALLTGLAIDLEKTEIRAPFDGVLQERLVETGDYVAPGGEVALVVELDPVAVTGAVTEFEVKKIETGQPARADLITGDTIEGLIRYVSAAADISSSTFTVEMEAPNPGGVPSGLTAELHIPYGTVRAHRVSPAILSLNEQGEFGVKIVDGSDTVRFIPARIVKSSNTAVWLEGLPDPARIITVGMGFARPGERVHAVMEAGLSSSE